MVLIAVAGILCGAVNSIAGGGSLILFPAMLATRMSPLVANVTNSVATWPGYAGGLVRFRPELSGHRSRMKPLLLATVIGSAAGRLLLVNTPSGVFDLVVSVLILVAAALLAFQPSIKRLVGEPHEGGRVWTVQLPAMIAAPTTLVGGYVGARVARHVNEIVLRFSVVGLGVAIAIDLLIKALNS